MSHADPTPEKIGDYVVVRRLGGSGSVDIFLALGEQPDGKPRLCELKLVRRVGENAKQLATELAREAAILRRLNHPAIVPMIDLFEDDQRIVLVLEYVEGASLEQILEAGTARGARLGEEAIGYLGRELASALGHAHEAESEEGEPTPVIHRNLHPGNVMISLDGQVRLTGFALGKILGFSADALAGGTTMSGTVKGTPGFMAPEQQRGERVTPRTDVYGLGVLLWTMLTGRRAPFGGPTLGDLTASRPALPEPLVTVLETALQQDPAKRRITCTEIECWLDRGDLAAGRDELRREVRAYRAALVTPGAPVDVTPIPLPEPRRAGAPELHAILDIPGIQEPPLEAAHEPSSAGFVLPADWQRAAVDAPSSSGIHPVELLQEAALDGVEGRPLTALQSIAVAAFTAGIVIAAGVLIARSDLAVPARQAAAPETSAAVTEPPAPAEPAASAEVAAAEPEPAASAGEPAKDAPAASAGQPARDAPAASAGEPARDAPAASAIAAEAPPDPTTLPAGFGFLKIASDGEATVYVNGAAAGAVNQVLQVSCGGKFVRLGTASGPGGSTRWLAPGKSLSIPCGGSVQQDMPLTPPGARDVLAH